MPRRKPLKGWDAKNKRWRKMIYGEACVVSIHQLGFPDMPAEQAEIETADAAREYWVKKAAQKEAERKAAKDASFEQIAITNRLKIKAVAEASGDAELAKQQDEKIASLERLVAIVAETVRLPNGEKKEAMTGTVELMRRTQQLTAAELLALNISEASTRKTPAEKLVGYQADQYLEIRAAKALAGMLAPGSYSNDRGELEKFVEWIGRETEIAAMSQPDTIRNYFTYLADLKANKKLGPEGCRGRFKTAIGFIKYLAEHEILDSLPRNIASREFIFKAPRKKIVASEVEKIRGLFEECSGWKKGQLFLLLMANVGMTSIDIGKLKKSEIHLEGRNKFIRRTRSKTEDQENVPEVQWKLWPKTARLLEENLSDHAELALLTDDGNVWWKREIERTEDGKVKTTKADNVASAFAARRKPSKKTGMAVISSKLQLKEIRKRSSTLLLSNKDYAQFHWVFLDHAPPTQSEESYSIKDQKLFDEAIDWLGKKYSF